MKSMGMCVNIGWTPVIMWYLGTVTELHHSEVHIVLKEEFYTPHTSTVFDKIF